MTSKEDILPSSDRSLHAMSFPVSYITHLQIGFDDKEFLQLLHYAKIDPKILTQPQARINGIQFREVITFSNKHYNNTLPIGIEIGDHFNVATHGIFGLAIATSANVGEALLLAQKYSHLTIPAIAFQVHMKEPSKLEIILTPIVDFGLENTALIEATLCSLKKITEHATKKIHIENVYFCHDDYDALPHYEKYFQCKIQLNANENRLCIKDLDLQSPLINSDYYTCELLKSQLDNLERTYKLNQSTWTIKVENYCQTNFQRLSEVSRQEVADYFHISSRTLSRKLQLEKQSFQSIYDRIFFETAEYFLLKSQLNTQQISDRLGFTNPKTFSKTFKRLSSLAPTEFRKKYFDLLK